MQVHIALEASTERIPKLVQLDAGVAVYFYDEQGNLLGIPIKFKASADGSKIAAELQEVDAGSFVIDSAGHISNG